LPPQIRNSEMEYRMATSKDFPQLARLRWEFRSEGGVEKPVVNYEEFIDACVLFMQQGIETGYHTHWIAEEGREILSHLSIHRVDLVPRPCKLKDQFGYITNNYTKPEHRNRGIGSELMRRVKEWAEDQDMELLLVHPSQEAVDFYQRLGFSAEDDVMQLKLRAYYS
jgi:ribosomal protein S18 acetylase RimI-like enzyme